MRTTTDTPAVLTATTGALTFSAMTALFPAAIGPEIAAALGVTPALIGLQISLVYAGAMLTSLIGGGITRRLGACRTTQWAIALFGLGALIASTGWLPSFILAAFFVGAGYGLTNPAAAHLLVRFTPAHRRSLVFGFKQTGVPLGGVIAGALAPVLAINFGWQVAMMVLIVPAVLGISWLQQRRIGWDDDRSQTATWLSSPLADIGLVWAHPGLRWAALASFFFSATQLCLTVFTVTLLVEDIRIGLVTAGLIMSAVQIFGVGGRVFWGWLADRLGNGLRLLMVINTASAMLAFGVSLMQPSWSLVVITGLLCAFSAVAIGWNGVYLAQITHLAPPDQIARASGGSLFITFAGVLFGPAAFSALHWLTPSYASTFAWVALASATGVIFLIAADRAQGKLAQ